MVKRGSLGVACGINFIIQNNLLLKKHKNSVTVRRNIFSNTRTSIETSHFKWIENSDLWRGSECPTPRHRKDSRFPRQRISRTTIRMRKRERGKKKGNTSNQYPGRTRHSVSLVSLSFSQQERSSIILYLSSMHPGTSAIPE